MTKLQRKTTQDPMDSALSTVVKGEIEDMPLTNIREYRLYNEAAAKANKKLGVCRYPLKQCPVELHPTERVMFGRIDQPTNPLPVHLSDHNIHFIKKLYPGQIYDLPKCVVSYLAEKGTPVWKWVDKPDGTKETVMSHKDPRFTLRTIQD